MSLSFIVRPASNLLPLHRKPSETLATATESFTRFILRSTSTKSLIPIASRAESPLTPTDPLPSQRVWKSNFLHRQRGVPMTGLLGSAPVNPLQLPFRMWNLVLEPELFLKAWTIKNIVMEERDGADYDPDGLEVCFGFLFVNINPLLSEHIGLKSPSLKLIPYALWNAQNSRGIHHFWVRAVFWSF